VDSEPKLIFKKVLGGDIRSNWIEGDLTGCVGIVDDAFTFIYIVNWVTLDEAYVDTQLAVCKDISLFESFDSSRSFQLPSTLSAATSPEMLFIYAEDTTHAVYSAYSLSILSNVLTKPMITQTIAPTIEQEFTFRQDGVDSLNFWIPTCRTLWDGRTGVFSRSLRRAPPPENFVADYATLSVVELNRDANGEVMERYNSGTVTRHMAHWFDPEIGELLGAPADWDVCAMGTFAKTAVWMELRRTIEPVRMEEHMGRTRICFAEFPPEEDVESQRENREIGGNLPAGGSGSGLGRQEQGTGVTIDHPTDWEELIQGEELIEELVVANAANTGIAEEETAESRQTADTLPQGDSSTTQHEGSPLAAAQEDFDPMPDHSVSDGMPIDDIQPPVSFGHFCEYELGEDWEKDYGGIYTVDFDDARGVAAFATGSGKVVLFEFV
jgi:hypothetical protein